MARKTAGIILDANIWARNAADGAGRYLPERLVSATPPGSAIVRANGWDNRFDAVQQVYVWRRQDVNQRFYEIDSFIADANEHGVLEWHTSVIYAHPAVVYGSDGALYRSVQGSTGVDPTTDYDRSHWVALNWGTAQNPAHIPNGADLNTLVTPGIYVGTAANTGVLVNAPDVNWAAAKAQITLEVQVSPGWTPNNPVRQLIVASDGVLYVRTRNTAATWTNWSEVGGTTTAENPVGTMLDFAGSSAPTGYLLCDGAAVSRTTYGSLFTAIGTAWGSGDGSTTFNVPDMRRRVAVGAGGARSDELLNTVGATGGSESVSLTVAQMPRHRHRFSYGTIISGLGKFGFIRERTRDPDDFRWPTDYEGGGQAHNNMQPSAVVTKIIKH